MYSVLASTGQAITGNFLYWQMTPHFSSGNPCATDKIEPDDPWVLCTWLEFLSYPHMPFCSCKSVAFLWFTRKSHSQNERSLMHSSIYGCQYQCSHNILIVWHKMRLFQERKNKNQKFQVTCTVMWWVKFHHKQSHLLHHGGDYRHSKVWVDAGRMFKPCHLKLKLLSSCLLMSGCYCNFSFYASFFGSLLLVLSSSITFFTAALLLCGCYCCCTPSMLTLQVSIRLSFKKFIRFHLGVVVLCICICAVRCATHLSSKRHFSLCRSLSI